ncbi:MFS transporter [Bacillus sp. CGMCC 1.16607]|uniref:MFS transporter n=1 Tax=Bacillus sp. CGMCC 1.16607 TaxID=3351842 RepID=UPI00362725AD
MDKSTRLWTKDFISISFSNFFLFMTFYFLLVSLPVMVIQQFDGSKTEAGLITTVFLISAILIRPIAGVGIEKFGIRSILLTALIIFLFASILYFFAPSLSILLVVRFLHGIGFGMATTATGGLVANIVPDSRRGEGMGYFIMSSNLAMVLGPFIGLTSIQLWDSKVLFSISVFCAMLALLAGLNVHFPTSKQKDKIHVPFRFQNFFEPSAVPISLVGAFFAIVYSGVLSFVSVYAKEIGLIEVSSIFFVVYAAVLLLSRPFTGRWFDRFGPNVIIFPCIILFAIGLFLLSVSHSASVFLISAALIGVGWGTIFPSLQTIAIQKAAPGRSATATATYLSIFDTGIGFGSFIVGMVVAEIGFRAFYINGSLYALVGLIVYYVLHARKQPSTLVHKESSIAG